MLGNLTQEQIALQNNTSVGYVTKTKSGLIKECKLPRLAGARQSAKGPVPAPVEYALDKMQEKILTRNVDANKTSLNSLSEENRKFLYFMFGAGNHPNVIIASTGLPSELVEIEYQRFLRFKDQDISKLQQALCGLMVSQNFQDKRLEELSKGQLSFDELFSLIGSFSLFRFKMGVQVSVDNRFMPLPEGWKRMICSRCGLPIEGVVIKPTELLGKAFQNILGDSPEYSRRCACDATLAGLAEYIIRIKLEKEDAERVQQAINSIQNSSSS